MKKTVLLISLMILAGSAAGGLSAQEGGGGTRSIFTLGAGSRAIAMGGAFSAIGDDPSVLYYNPAALKLNPYPAVMANHIQLFSGFSDASYDFIGLAYPTMSIGSFGLGFMTAGTGGIREFDSYSQELGEISYRESQAVLSYAFDFPWEYLVKLTVGSSVKILNQRVGDFSDTGTGYDVGFLLRQDYLKGLVLGCNLQDIVGAETKLVAVSDKVYRTIMLGAGYTYSFANGSRLVMSVQMDMPEKADNDLRFGAEYDYKQIFSFRVGFDSESITAGVGFGWNRYKGDYGFFTREEAGSSHPVSVLARIGTSIEDRIRIEEERRVAEEERMIAEFFNRRVAGHIDSARVLQESGKPEEALDELKIALEYDPANETATTMIEEVRARIVEIQAERSRTEEKSILINQHFSLGLRYYSNDEYILARAEWKNVLELDPSHEGAIDYLERTNGKLDEEIRQYRTAAIDYERRGRLASALGEWNMIRMIDPENSEAIESAARIGRRMEELDRNYRAASSRLRTIEYFESAMRAFSEGRYADAEDLLLQVLDRQPDHEEARDLLDRVRRKMTPISDEQREQVRQLYIEGMKHFTQKNYSAAIEVWRRALEIDPDNESIRRNIEEAQQRIGKVESPEEE